MAAHLLEHANTTEIQNQPQSYYDSLTDQCVEDIKSAADDLCTKIREIQSKLTLQVNERKNQLLQNDRTSSNSFTNGVACVNAAYEEDAGERTQSAKLHFTVPTFVKGNPSLERLEEMFGIIEEKYDIISFEAKIDKISKFKCKGTGKVDVIIPVTDNKAWISCNRSPQDVHMTNGKGESTMTKILPFACEGFGVNEKGDFLLSDFKGKSIVWFRKNGKKEKFLDTSPQHPLGLYVKNGIVTVCLTDKWDFNTYKLGTRHIMQYSTKGVVLKKVKNSGTSRLFTMPYKVHVNDMGDICALDIKDEKEGRVVILDKDGYRRGTYSGHASDKKFIPVAICCRNPDEIMVSDISTKSVYLINMSGLLLGVLLTDKLSNGIQTSISVNSDKTIWIGNDAGEIHIFKYGPTMPSVEKRENALKKKDIVPTNTDETRM